MANNVTRWRIFLLLLFFITILSTSPVATGINVSNRSNRTINTVNTQSTDINNINNNNRDEIVTNTESSKSRFVLDDETDLVLRKKFDSLQLTIGDLISPYFKDTVDKEITVTENGNIQYIVKLEAGDPLAFTSQYQENSLTTVSYNKQLSFVTLEGSLDNLNNFLLRYGVDLGVQFAQPRQKITLTDLSISGTPTDPLYSQQWGHQRIQAGAALDELGVYNSTDVLVAVIDTGIDYTHPELDGVYVPLGYDWVNDDNDPMDDHSHGTHVAGIIAAEINNSIGISGVAPVKVMAEKFLDQYGSGWDDAAANAITHAVDQGADILSNSWGGRGESDLIREAIDYATANDVIVVAAAGNGYGPDADFNYPASHPDVISVSSIDSSDRLSYFSSYGQTVDVAAPGSNILSTVLNEGYDSYSGTSMATPHVSGVLSLMLLQQPDLSAVEARALLRETSEDLGTPYFDEKFGYGLVNAVNATREAKRQPVDLFPSIIVPQEKLSVGQVMEFQIGIFNYGTNTALNVVADFYKNNILYNTVNFGDMAGSTYVIENLTILLAVSKDLEIRVELRTDSVESNLANNIDTEMISFGSSSYKLTTTAFSWVDTTNAANISIAGDDNAAVVDLPFDFTFYKAVFDRLFVSTNGWASFIDTTPYNYYSQPFPTDTAPYAIAPLWGDLAVFDWDGSSMRQLFTSTQVVIEWNNVTFLGGFNQFSFQMVLDINGDIYFNYLDVTVERDVQIGLNRGVLSGDSTTYNTMSGQSLSQTTLKFSSNNVFVANEIGVSVNHPNEYVLNNDAAEFELLVYNYGTQDAAGVNVNLNQDGTLLQTNSSLSIPAGEGVVLYYTWTPTSLGLFNFSFAADVYLNETDTVNNVYDFSLTSTNSRLGTPINSTVDLFTYWDESLTLSYSIQETSDPVWMEIVISFTENLLGQTFELDRIPFNVLTFTDPLGNPIQFVIPSDADVGYTNSAGTLVNQTTIELQGVSKSVFRFDDIWGGITLYDTQNFNVIAIGFVDYYDSSIFYLDIELEYASFIPLATNNQYLLARVEGGVAGSTVPVDLFVRNVGTSDETGSTIRVFVDNVLDGTIQVPALSSGEGIILSYQLVILDGFHDVEISLDTVTGETFIDDNSVYANYKSLVGIAIFQDDYSFGSDKFDTALPNMGFLPVYYNSSDIGIVDLSSYDRVVIASDQSLDFVEAVENNVAWFESFASSGGVLQIDAARTGYDDPFAPRGYNNLPGGASIIYDGSYEQFTEHIDILDENAAVFNDPWFIDGYSLNHWGPSAIGYLDNLPLLAQKYASFELEPNQVVLAAIPMDMGSIIYTTLTVEQYWASWDFLENLLNFVPDFPNPSDTPLPTILGVNATQVIEGSGLSLVYNIFSVLPKEYVVLNNGVEVMRQDWYTNATTVTYDLSSMPVGTYNISVRAYDYFDRMTTFATAVTIVPVAPPPVTTTSVVTTTATTTTTTTVSTSTSVSESSTSSSSSSSAPISIIPILSGIMVIATVHIIRRKNQR